MISIKDEGGRFLFFKSLRNIFDIPNDANSVVCCWMYHSILLGLLLKVCKRKITLVLMIRNGLDSPSSLRGTTLAVVWICAHLSWLANKAIYCSSSSMQAHARFGYEMTNACYLYNGVDFPTRCHLNKNSKNIVTFSTIARYEPQKGYVVLLDALTLVDNMNFPGYIDYLIFGENISLLPIRKFKKINLKIFDASQAKIDAESILEQSHCHILPSLSEGFANINLEALSMRNFIICSETGDSHIFPKECCSTFPLSDSKKLAELIFKFINSPPKESDLDFVQEFILKNFPLTNFDDLVYHTLNA